LSPNIAEKGRFGALFFDWLIFYKYNNTPKEDSMRFLEFKTLLEYDRSKTADALGNGIVKAAQRDAFLRSKRLDPEQTVAAVIDEAEAADPTTNKQYVQWIVRQFTKKAMKFEDLYKLKEELTVFFKTKGQHKRLGINSDINAYDWKTLAVQAKKLGSTDIEADGAEDTATNVEGAKVLHDGPTGTLTVPQTEAASCELGKGTKWCTAGQERNQFDYYNNMGPLYIWNDKKLKKKFQLHFETGQFMDAQDNPVGDDMLTYLSKKNPVTSKLFAQKSPIILKSYLDRLGFEDDEEREDYEIEGVGDEILDYDIKSLVDGMSSEELQKVVSPAAFSSKEHTDGYKLQFAVFDRLVKNPKELESALSEKNRAGRPVIERPWMRYVLERAPEQIAIEYVKDHASDKLAPTYAARIALRFKKRLPEFEDLIKQNPQMWDLYTKKLGIAH
jgi:hypothetical protein